MIDIPGDLVWDLQCVQQASYLEGDPLVWMLPLYLHVNQKSDYDYDTMMILPYMDMAAILFNGAEPFVQTDNTLLTEDPHVKSGENCSSSLREEDI